MNQQIFKGKKKAAEGGHKLLKKKADALKVKFRDYAKAIAETKQSMSGDSASAYFSLTQAEYAAGNFKQKVAEGSMTARLRVGAGVDNVAGVSFPSLPSTKRAQQQTTKVSVLLEEGKRFKMSVKSLPTCWKSSSSTFLQCFCLFVRCYR